MTEISKNSRNKGAVTDSNTVERSKEGPTHPYSGNDSETPSNCNSLSIQTREVSHDMSKVLKIWTTTLKWLSSTSCP